MSATEAESDLAMPDRQPVFRTISVGGSPGLEEAVRLDLSPRRTVLVGRNNAGKSLLLTAIQNGADAACMRMFLRSRMRVAPAITFYCEVEQSNGTVFAYAYSRGIHEGDEELSAIGSERTGRRSTWSERCWDTASGNDYWKVENGVLTIPGTEPVAMQPGLGLLAIRHDQSSRDTFDLLAPKQARILRNMLAFTYMVPAGIPRSDTLGRTEILLTKPADRKFWQPARGGATPSGRVENLAARLANLNERSPETFREFVELARQLRLAENVTVKVFEARDEVPSVELEAIAMVEFDGTNIGLLSDGTLRTGEILNELLRPSGGLLLIEEPETAVHPGLLSRVLSTLDAYAADRQIVVSTHSPLVVSWCSPDDVRFVMRVGGKTSTSRLSAEQVRQVEAYLHDEGTLGEYVLMHSSE